MKSLLRLFVFLFFVVILSTVGNSQYSQPYCGDNFCDPGEEGWCSDCDVVKAGYCGDGFCDAGEESWCSDCTVPSYCGDGFCDSSENGWCSDCSAKPFCGDGFCDAGESYSSCAKDCGCPEKLLDNYRCSGNDRQREKVKSDCANEWVKLEACAYGCNAATAACNPKKCEPKYLDTYRCSGSQREILELQSDCATQKYVPVGEPCIYGCKEDAAPLSSNLGRKIAFCVSPPTIVTCFPSASCSTLGCGAYDSCGNFCGSCPPSAADNAPTAAIAVPASAAPNSQFSIAVSGNDDKDVAQLLLFDAGSSQIASFDCAGVQTSCSSTFTVTALAAFSTSYTFKARSKDSAGQLSAFAPGTGTTTAAPGPAPSPTPAPVTVSTQLISQPSVSTRLLLRFPLQPLFLRSASLLDSDCVRPGESALLAVKVQNTGRSTLKDVSFTATVSELGIRARTGPHSITRADRSSKFMQLNVPADVEEGSYFLRLSVTNNKFAKVVHRIFTVDGSC